jgi:hypothetical protein
MLATVQNVEIRGCESRLSKSTGAMYLMVRFEDETGKSYELLDRDMEHQTYYTKGVMADLQIKISLGKYKNLEISNVMLQKQ